MNKGWKSGTEVLGASWWSIVQCLRKAWEKNTSTLKETLMPKTFVGPVAGPPNRRTGAYSQMSISPPLAWH